MNEYECDTCAYRCVKIYSEPCTNCIDGSKYEPEERSEETMTRVKSFENAVNAINKRSGPIETGTVMVALLIEIAGSLAVIADAMAEKKDGENHDD